MPRENWPFFAKMAGLGLSTMARALLCRGLFFPQRFPVAARNSGSQRMVLCGVLIIRD